MDTKQVKFTMLCPSCQHTEDVTLTACIGPAMEEVRLTVGSDMVCPRCGVQMYQADTPFLDTLKELNRMGIHTSYHCASIHGDGHVVAPLCNKLTREDGKPWYMGPYLIVRSLTHSYRKKLYHIVRSGAMDNVKVELEEDPSSKVKDFFHIPLTNRDWLTIRVYIREPIRDACIEGLEVLKDLLNTWILYISGRIIYGAVEPPKPEDFVYDANGTMISMSEVVGSDNAI